jgi:hypothetical protein
MGVDFLDLGKYRNNRRNDTQNQVEADEKLVECAAVRVGIKNIEEDYDRDTQHVKQDREKQQTWKKKQKNLQLS